MITRRAFFRGLMLTAGGMLVPATPLRSFFLAPRGGWAQPLRIRRVQQYCINTDSYHLRYDATWDLPNGMEVQYHVDYPGLFAAERVFSDVLNLPTPIDLPFDKLARGLLYQRMAADGGHANSDKIKLRIPAYLPPGHARFLT